ncbi:MAG: AAA family ATPase [Hoeflea sp.]|uniref:AAA family ATPase n=1 Tax=Hoeflea sp. TaxID=1940281 RepID=UPI0032987D0F
MSKVYVCLILRDADDLRSTLREIIEAFDGKVLDQDDKRVICGFPDSPSALRCVGKLRSEVASDQHDAFSAAFSKVGREVAIAIATRSEYGVVMDAPAHADLDPQTAATFAPVDTPDGVVWHQLPLATNGWTRLTSREREIAELFAQGRTYQDIAKALSRAPSTVRTHLATIYRKLGVSSKFELLQTLQEALSDQDEAGKQHETAHSPCRSASVQNVSERRRLTLVVINLDLCIRDGSELDIELQMVAVDALSERIEPQLARIGGALGDRYGPRLVACFGWRSTAEDDAEMAARFALHVREVVTRLPLSEGVTASCRIGLNNGLCVTRHGSEVRFAGTFFGQTLTRAEELAMLAPANGILAEARLERSLGGAFETVASDLHSEAIEIVGEVVRPDRFAARAGARPAALVGRAEELALLMSRWSRARQGDGQAVLLVGEAGIGKSRLARTIQANAESQGARTLVLQCAPQFSDTPLWPFSQWLRTLAAINGDRTAQSGQLRSFLSGFGAEMVRRAGIFEIMLGIQAETDDPELAALTAKARRERILDTVGELIARINDNTPVMLLFEDAHWADSSSLEVLARIAASRRGQPLMAVATCRPGGLVEDWKVHFDQLSVNRLDHRSAMILARQSISGPIHNANLLDTVVIRAGGVPLFVEELARTFAAPGRESPQATIGTEVPEPLADFLAARFDGLELKQDILHYAACIGREFSRDLLVAVSEHPANVVDDIIATLVDQGLVDLQTPSSRTRYAFRHVLYRDAAYGRILRGSRQQMHARIAAVLDKKFPELAARHPELVGHHLLLGGNPSASVPHLTAAARAAMAKASYSEASALIERGLQALETQDETPEALAHGIDLRFLAYAARGLRGNPSELLALLKDAEALAGRLGDPVRMCKSLSSQTYLLASAGQIDGAIEVGQRSIKQITVEQNRNMFVMGKLMLSRAVYAKGRYVETVHHSTKALRLLGRDVGEDDREVGLLNQVYNAFGWAILGYSELGRFNEADSLIHEATALLPNLRGTGAHERLWLAFAAARKCLLTGDHTGTCVHLEPILDLCASQYPAYLPRVFSTLGASHVAAGRLERGLKFLEQAEAEARAITFRFGHAQVLTLLGEALWQSGNAEQALLKIREGLSMARDIGESGNEAWALLAMGRILKDTGEADEAVEYLEGAERIARTLEIGPLLAQCGTALTV